MKHKMRTLQGQYKSLLKRNAELTRTIENVEKTTTDLISQYKHIIRRSCQVTTVPESLGRIINIRVSLDCLDSANFQKDMLDHLCYEISRKAGWITPYGKNNHDPTNY